MPTLPLYKSNDIFLANDEPPALDAFPKCMNAEESFLLKNLVHLVTIV